ncbi:DUF6702 family protein [Asticcacaulis excentricus]|uniref:Orphan protein n=1 Tax=Asticcacaulis excentricus (strain ATCC 15261 / DSM 4724 / KCTC 12464 / NCIMB 9791 / VKM B-1370 / CB 48) TaxID=573065 RepID=E8RUB7_ASTEC|nr:DUF6702 family protein [Asticcacaulis excentricus]ADU15088.1 hypothetical protein Astex_3456 [Asticcacaulis excentricus CB 48]
MIRRGFLLGGAALILASPAWAHRGHHTLSVVEIAADGTVTVIHTLSAHDSEPELVELAPDAQPSVDDPDALKALEGHLRDAFTINGQRLDFFAYEAWGDDLQFTFKGKLDRLPKTVTVAYGLFPNSRKTGVGLVNVRINGVTRSLTFAKGDAPETVGF